MPLDVFPDAEAVVRAFLIGSTAINDLVDDRVYGMLPADAVFPLARIKRIGGVPAAWQRLDHARLMIDCWGRLEGEGGPLVAYGRDEAWTLAGQIIHDLLDAMNVTVSIDGTPEGLISKVELERGASWLPDQQTDRPRVTFDVGVYLHRARTA